MNRFTATSLLLLAIAASAFAGAAEAAKSPRPTLKRRAVTLAAADATSAADALFVQSSLAEAKRLATFALKRDSQNPLASFTLMEAAALEGDQSAELDSAIRLCTGTNDNTPFAEIAAGRIRELAANTSAFRQALPRLRALAQKSAQSDQLRLAMVSAAEDGAPEFNLLQQSRESGLLTDWRLVGPIGKLSNIAFDQKFAPELDGLKKNVYNSRRIEYLQFANGRFALPRYMKPTGIFYASSTVKLASGGEWRLRVESPGTMQVFIDGRPAVTRDNRQGTQPEVIIETLHLEGGDHSVMVKFVPAAAPFRIAIMAPTGVMRRHTKPTLYAGPESEYVSAELHYYRGDPATAIRELTSQASDGNSASLQFALANAWQHIAGTDPDAVQEAPERATALRAALRLAPTAAAVEEQLAQSDLAADHIDDSLQHLKSALSLNPESELALQLLSRIAVRFHWNSEGSEAFDSLVRLHPSCSALSEAASYFADTAQFQRATRLESQMRHCAPASPAYATWIASAGRHTEAARELSAIVRDFPLDRETRELEIRERLLASDNATARTLTKALADLAPNSQLYADAAADPAILLDTQYAPNTNLIAGGPHNDPFVVWGNSDWGNSEFYGAFRRDGLALIRENANRKYTGGPAVTLLDDKVALLNDDGSGAIYFHKITRVLNRDGILLNGEASIPQGAHLLELRTIKADLTIAEPEFNRHKTTISMPALAAGDSIEQEYVLPLAGPDALDDHPEAFEFTFGSFTAPVLFSRFVLIAPADISLTTLNDAPAAKSVALAGSVTARVWERNTIAQSVRETAMPHATLLPVVRLVSPRETPELLRDIALNTVLDAARPGPRSLHVIAQFDRTTDEQLARRLYRFVTINIRSDDSSFASGDATSAEDSLAAGEGNRTSTLLALARAAGLSTQLVLARSTAAGQNAYSHPLVLFRLANRTVVADPESDTLPFNSASPDLDRSEALLIPLAPNAEARVDTVKLPDAQIEERSLANGDITFDDSGSFTAEVSISMGATRGAEMREILRGTPPADRPQFFQQLALRLFPGAIDATGEVRDEDNPDQPLTLLVNCRSPRYLDFSTQSVDMDQLVPSLGLRRMYAAAPTRKFPLYVDSLLFEIADFRVHLPAGVSIARAAPDYVAENEFGRYGVTFQIASPSDIEITREFHVPMQVIPTAQYQAFSRFANQIDDAERQRLTLHVSGHGATQATLR